MSHTFSLIYAKGSNNEFGYMGRLPWSHIKEDMKFFSNTTKHVDTSSNVMSNKKNIVIMGRNTFNSIGKVLPDRINIIISKTMVSNDRYIVANSLENALELSYNMIDKNLVYKIFVIGGLGIIEESLLREDIESIYESIISTQDNTQFKADLYLDSRFTVKYKITKIRYVTAQDYNITINEYVRNI